MKQFIKNDESGAIVVEATVALAVFIFAIFTLLSVVNICYIQARIGSALASSTKEVSQYSYLYYKFGLNEAQAKMNDKNAESRATATQTIDGVGVLMDSFSTGKESVSTGDFQSLINAANTGAEEVKSLTALYKDQLKDPKQFILGMASLAGEELLEEGKNKLGQLMCYAFMQKNLVESPTDDADRFLRRYKVEGGLDGLKFNGSSLMAYGKSNEIQMVVTYKIQVVKLLGIDITYTIRQCAKSSAWGNGVSQIFQQQVDAIEAKNGEGVWDLPPLERGKVITNLEKKKFTCTSDKNGFDGYNPSGNQFIQVTAMYGETYKTEQGIKSKLNSTLNDMKTEVSKLGEEITVKNSSGEDVKLNSDPYTRTYKIVLVVPENADKATINKINKAVSDFIAAQAANEIIVTVDVKYDYGIPTETKGD